MSTAAAASPLPAASPSLPMQADDLLGRESELETARESLIDGGYRLLTLLGPGGIGKTRLALGIGSSLRDSFAGGSWFVDLTRTRDPLALDSHILRSLGGKFEGACALEALKRWLQAAGDVLVILDNFEHVIAGASIVAHILESCPDTRFIVTSREPLKLTWEQRLVVQPLAVPDLVKLPTDEEIAAAPSVALFMRHATAINPNLGSEGRDLQAVADLCARLEGVPLAIELAATRANVLTPASILEHLDGSQRFLRASIRDAPDRHQSIEATLDWSFDLLNENERTALRRLSVFLGGFTFDAAAEILGSPGDEGLELLASLVDKAFLVVKPSLDGDLRYSMRGPVRAYAYERLSHCGEAEEAEAAHAAHYRDWLSAQTGQYRHAGYMVWWRDGSTGGPGRPGSPTWARALALDYTNLDVAMHFFGTRGDAESVLTMAAALQWFWWKQGELETSIEVMRSALAGAGTVAPALRADALHGLGMLLRQQGRYPEARTTLQESISAARGAMHHDLTGRSLVEFGLVMLSLGRLEEARAVIVDAQHLWESLGDRWGVAVAESYLSVAETMQGHLNRAESLGRHAAVELAKLGDSRSAMVARLTAAHAAILADRHEPANDLLFECLPVARELDEPRLISAMLEVAARSLLERGDVSDAAILLGACQRVAVRGVASIWNHSSMHEDSVSAALSMDGEESRERLRHGETIELAAALDIAENALLAEPGPPSPATIRPAPVRNFLSPREQEVLQLVSLGRSNREIARNIFVSESTVKFHVTSILNKLGANTRTEAVSSAMRRGILSIKEADEAAI